MRKKKKKKASGNLLIIPSSLVNLLLKSDIKNVRDLLALFIFYYQTALHQKTNQPYCISRFISKGLRCNPDIVRRCRKELKKLNLIEEIRVKERGKFKKGSFTKINYYFGGKMNENHTFSKDLTNITNFHLAEFSPGENWQGEMLIKRNQMLIKRNQNHRRGTQAPRQSDFFSNDLVNSPSKKEKLKKEKKKKKNTMKTLLPDNSINPKKDFDEKMAIYLVKLLTRKRKVMRRINLKKWKMTFAKFRRAENLEKRRIKEVLHWYSDNIGKAYVPVAYSAETFCKKFLAIEDAIERSQRPHNERPRPGEAENKKVVIVSLKNGSQIKKSVPADYQLKKNEEFKI